MVTASTIPGHGTDAVNVLGDGENGEIDFGDVVSRVSEKDTEDDVDVDSSPVNGEFVGAAYGSDESIPLQRDVKYAQTQNNVNFAEPPKNPMWYTAPAGGVPPRVPSTTTTTTPFNRTIPSNSVSSARNLLLNLHGLQLLPTTTTTSTATTTTTSAEGYVRASIHGNGRRRELHRSGVNNLTLIKHANLRFGIDFNDNDVIVFTLPEDIEDGEWGYLTLRIEVVLDDDNDAFNQTLYTEVSD